MNTNPAPAPATLHPDSSGSRQRTRATLLCISVLWLVGFNLYFYSLSLPNNAPIARLQVWQELPYYLLLLSPSDATPSGWSYFPQRLDLLLIAGIILAGAWGFGHLLLRLTRPIVPRNGAERTALAFGLGLSALSLLTLGCGLMGLLSRWVLGGLIAASVAMELIVRTGWLGSNGVSPQAGDVRKGVKTSNASTLPQPLPGREGGFVKWACLIAAAPYVLAMLLAAMLPSTDFDYLEYHLEGPKEYFLAGRISMLPHNVYTSFPFLTEMIDLLAMVLRGDWYRGAMAGQLVLMTFGPLTALAIYAAGRRWFNPAAGWVAALIYLSTPWTFRISTIAYTEGGLSFYLFASLLATMLAIERMKDRQCAIRNVLLAGLLAGSAMACKYPGVVSVVIPLGLAIVAAPFFVGMSRTDCLRVAGKSAVCFGLGVLLTIGPWLAKNAVETGNPVYPLAYSVFGGKDWNAEANAKWKQAHSPDDYDVGRVLWGKTDKPANDSGETVRHPAWILDVSAQNDWLSPLLYGFAPLVLIGAGGCRTSRWLWLYVGYLFITWWVFTHRLDRFWVPMIPVVALLAGAAVVSVRGAAWKIVSAICIAAALLFNLAVVMSGVAGDNQFLMDLNYARDWAANLTVPEIAYLNREYRAGGLPKDTKVLCVGEAQVFDAEFPVVYDTVFDDSIFEQWTTADDRTVPAADRPMRASADISKTLHDERIGLILVKWTEVLRYRLTYTYTDYVTPSRFDRLEQARVLMQPLTFATLVLPGLTPEELEVKRKAWQPGIYRLRDGRSVFIGSVRKALETNEVQEIEHWAPSLFGEIDQGRVLITSQIYRVAD